MVNPLVQFECPHVAAPLDDVADDFRIGPARTLRRLFLKY
jgi:hypothetical protein